MDLFHTFTREEKIERKIRNLIKVLVEMISGKTTLGEWLAGSGSVIWLVPFTVTSQNGANRLADKFSVFLLGFGQLQSWISFVFLHYHLAILWAFLDSHNEASIVYRNWEKN